jgi:hypothetical protein
MLHGAGLDLAQRRDLFETHSASLGHQLGGLPRAREARVCAQVEGNLRKQLSHHPRLLRAFFGQRHLCGEHGPSVGTPIAHFAVPHQVNSLAAASAWKS